MPEQHIIRDKYSKSRMIEFIENLDLAGKPWLFKWNRHNPNSWPMKKTWRMWMSETAEWMAARGATMPLCMKDGKTYGQRPFNAQDAHELFVSQHLGLDANGKRYKTASGEKGEMLRMMDMHLAWATERGLFLTVPGEGEFMKLKQGGER
ncbi:hypothetical protein [Microbulbifer sp. JMSA008]|uniref:hypothetical protein n=1 Tax=Microbulbifer sp. JMSA008 TaxID=3243373 RepID=UPI004039D867